MTYRNLDKALLFLRNQVFCLKIWKLWQAPTILQFNIFCWNVAHVFYLQLPKQWCVGFFLLYLDFELFAKTEKDLFSTHSFFTLLLISQDLKKEKKFRKPFCRHYYVENVRKVSAKNIKIYGSWNSSKSSIFQAKNLASWK